MQTEKEERKRREKEELEVDFEEKDKGTCLDPNLKSATHLLLD